MQKERKSSIFLDTNIFLHFKHISEIDWLSFMDADEVELVICITVIEELDEKKGDPRLGDRAKNAIQTIEKFDGGNGSVRSGVTLVTLVEGVQDADYPTNFNSNNFDSRILNWLTKYQSENKDRTVAIATGDLAMTLRAKAKKINAIKIPESLRMPPPVDLKDAEIRRLKAKVLEHENRSPKLSIGLGHPGATISQKNLLEISPEKLSDVVDEAKELSEIKRKHPKLPNHLNNYGRGFGAIDILRVPEFLHVSAGQIEEYNTELDSFYEKYAQYITARKLVFENRVKSVPFDLWLINEGGKAATDIELKIETDTLTNLILVENETSLRVLLQLPKEPNPPEQPEPMQQLHGTYMNFSRINPVYEPYKKALQASQSPNHDPTVPVIVDRKLPSNKLEAKIQRLKHGNSVKLPTLFLYFSDVQGVVSCGANVRITYDEDIGVIEKEIGFRRISPDARSNPYP